MIFERLRNVRLLDRVAPRQVRDGARQFENAVVRPRGQLHLTHGGSRQTFACFVQPTELTHFGHAHVRVADYVNCLRETDAIFFRVIFMFFSL